MAGNKVNPLDYERFNRLFHITNSLCLLVRKLDLAETQQGYLSKIQEDIDKLFIDNVTEQKESL